MKKWWIWTLVALVIVSVPVIADEVKKAPGDVLSKGERNRLVKALKPFIEETNEYKREGLMENVRNAVEKLEKSKKIGPFTAHPTFFSSLITESSQGSFKPRGFLKGKLKEYKNEETARGTTYKNAYWLWLPRKYTTRQSWPLVLGLHPPGETGESYFNKTYKDTPLTDQAVFVFPTMQAGAETWTSVPGRYQILALTLAKIREEYNVDRTRIFLDGSGLSGEQVLTLGSWYADLFAGVVVRGCQPPDKLFYHNFKHLPVFLAVGDGDSKNLKAMEGMSGELSSAGHANCKLHKVAGASDAFLNGAGADITPWVLEQKLVDYPEEITWSTTDRGTGGAYWMKITQTELGDDLVATVKAKINRETNTIEIQANENALKMTVFLNDAMVDMGNPVKISTNGNDWSGKKDRSLEMLLKSYLRRGDPTRLFSGQVQLDVPK